jgi:hypothetical protein
LFFTIFSTAKKEEPSHDDRPPKRPKKKTKDKKRKGGEADEKNTIFAALDKPEEETEAPLLIDETVETPSDEGNGAVEGDGPSTENKTWATPFIKIINKIKAMIKAVRDKIVGLFNKIRYTTKEIYAKIKDVVENISYYVEIIKSDRFKKAIKLCWRQLGAIVRSIRPTKLKAQLVFGTGDPASTGQILEFYSILYPFIGNNVVITPDFEAKIMEGEFLIKGRVTVIVLLRAAWTIYRDKNIRKLIKLLKREVS